MGMVELRPGESVFYPAPYVENEVVPLVITSLRVVQMVDAGRQEMDGGKITFIGRQSMRPLIFLGIFFLLSGLPVLGYGAYLFLSVRGMPTFEEQPPAQENPDFEDPAITRYKAIGFAAGGLIWCAIGLLCCKKQRHLVICRGERKVLKLRVKDKTAQMQVMMTVQAMMNAAKMSVPVPAPAPEPPKGPAKKA